ncbi:hypothetical protein GCM10009601_59320 [Streptomyces thermospinosisporus]|uniref:Uncharacterized protein n=2 Tax=Streptomyces thermospinosisporus TaxID=161482 RepID=A0ABN1Z830_9ACTN
MLDMITPTEADHSKALELIYSGKIETTRTWVETEAMLIAEVIGEPFGRYYQLVITDLVDQDDVAELNRLETELGKPLGECIIEKEHHDNRHSFFPGSQSFDLLTIYAG